MRVVYLSSSDFLNQILPQFTRTALGASSGPRAPLAAATLVSRSQSSVGGSDRAKHIDLREHFVHEAVDKKILKLEPINSTDNAADLLTKPLLKALFWPLRKRLLGL